MRLFYFGCFFSAVYYPLFPDQLAFLKKASKTWKVVFFSPFFSTSNNSRYTDSANACTAVTGTGTDRSYTWRAASPGGSEIKEDRGESTRARTDARTHAVLAIMFKKKNKDQQQSQAQQQQPTDLNSPAPQATPNYGGQPDVVGERQPTSTCDEPARDPVVSPVRQAVRSDDRQCAIC